MITVQTLTDSDTQKMFAIRNRTSKSIKLWNLYITKSPRGFWLWQAKTEKNGRAWMETVEGHKCPKYIQEWAEWRTGLLNKRVFEAAQ